MLALRPSETVSLRILPHASYSAVHTLRLLYCVQQSVCRDGRVGNKPIRAALRTALGVRVGFSAADRFRGRSYTVRRVYLPFLCLSVRPSEIVPTVRTYWVRTGNGYFVRLCFQWQGCLPASGRRWFLRYGFWRYACLRGRSGIRYCRCGFYFNELVVAVPMIVCGFAIAGFADQVAALVVIVVYA